MDSFLECPAKVFLSIEKVLENISQEQPLPYPGWAFSWLLTYTARCNGRDIIKNLCGFISIPLWCLKKIKALFLQATVYLT